MGNPVNLKEFPRAEFWADTKWEPYTGDIQQGIRGHLTTYGGDLAEFLEFNVDLDESDEEWMYRAHLSPRHRCPPTSWIPGKRSWWIKRRM